MAKVLAGLDGLMLHGRLVRVVEPRTYPKRDGTTGTSYPAVVVLAGDETLKVEFRTIEARDDALMLGGPSEGIGEVDPSGMVVGLPVVAIPVRALGAWDPDARQFAPVRLAGVAAD